MKANILHIATAFRIGAFVLGFPSLTATVLYIVFRLRQWMTPPVSPPGMKKNPDVIVLTTGIIARVFGAFVRVFEHLRNVLFGGLAVISLVALIYAVALWFTGRGLQTHEGWARVEGGVLVSAPPIVALLSLVALAGMFML